MVIMSAAFEDGGNIPKVYTCDGQNINPPLDFADVPGDTASLALIVHDPDAPTKDWTHWLVWNIPPRMLRIPTNAVPAGASRGVTDNGTKEWSGPCPPEGEHRYFFELYALDTVLDLPEGSTRETLEKAIEGHQLARSVLTGVYARA